MRLYILENYTTMRKKEILPFVTTWMDLEGPMLSEISQIEKDKYFMVSLICGIRGKKKKKIGIPVKDRSVFQAA